MRRLHGGPAARRDGVVRQRARAGLRGRVLAAALGVATSFCVAGAAARAEEPPPGEAPLPPASDPGEWEFSLAAYGWLTDITGRVTARDVSVDLDPQLWNDIVRNLDGALMGGLEARYRGRWLVNLDLLGAQISQHIENGPYSVGFGPRTFTRELRSTNLSIPVETRLGTLEVPIRIDPGTLRVDVPRVETSLGPFDVDVKSLTIESRVQLGYRVCDAPVSRLRGRAQGGDSRRLRVDLFVGLRYWYLRTEVEIDSPPIRVPEFSVTSSISGGSARTTGGRIPPQTVALPSVRLPDVRFGGATFGGTAVGESASSWWIDPLVGLRVGADLTERIGVVVAGNVGGFDIGSASRFSWEALAYLDWRFGDTTSLALGYRGLGFERNKGSAQADVVMHGPLLGLIFRF